MHDGILREGLLEQLANYKPTVTIAESSKLHHHIIYYPPHASSSMKAVIETLEDLPVYVGNASAIESQALVTELLVHLYLTTSHDTSPHGESCISSSSYTDHGHRFVDFPNSKQLSYIVFALRKLLIVT